MKGGGVWGEENQPIGEKKKIYIYIYIYIKYCEFLHKAKEEDEKMKPTD